MDMETKPMMYNAAEKIRLDFASKTRELLNAKNDARRFKKLNRERSDIIRRARRLGVRLDFTS